jgi:hypothetical protein
MIDTKTKYTETGKEIEKKISLLREKLKSHQTRFKQDPTNWVYVGDLTNLNEKLGEIVSFLR